MDVRGRQDDMTISSDGNPKFRLITNQNPVFLELDP